MSEEMSDFTSIMLVAGRMLPKNSPWARPTFSPIGNVGDIDASAHDVTQGRSRLRQSGFDVTNGLHGLKVGVVPANDLAIFTGGGGTGNVDRRTDAYRSRVADDGLPGCAARVVMPPVHELLPFCMT